ncbi:restriction endonuclease subunit S [Sphingobacterium spiritivorum]|uniref:restriction endonuclease subunit S n=1 Tax=Sphingobacterium spiritivorum TaxID=258 RepID=UPI003DA26C61
MVETKFKHTDIGLIPEDWEVVNWNDIFDFKSTASYSRADLKNQGKIGYIHYGDIHTKINALLDTDKFVSGYISNEQIKTYPIIKKGDLIIADASEDYSGVGKGFEVINEPNIPMISGLHTFLAREKQKGVFANGFKGYFYNNPLIKKQYDSLATGLKVYSLSKNSFQNIKIPLPPLPEQRAIAEVLSDTDTWVESLEKLIAKKQLIKQGVMQQLFTPKEDWEVKKLGEVCVVIGGGTPSTFNNEFWNGNINWFTPTEVGYKKYLTSSNRKISEAGLMNSSANMLPINSILLTTRAGIGDVGILKVEACTNQGFQSLVCHSDTHYEFIYYLMQTKKNELLNNASGSTFLEISPNKVKSIEIQIPSFPEQTRISTILSDMDAEIEVLEQKLAKAKQIKQGLMQELLTGRIRLVQSNDKKEAKPASGHNDHFNDAVLIGTMASCFASERFPLTRFKYTKVSYLLKRYKEEQTTGYLKKAAGPYKPETRYGGAEKIAINRKYIAVKKSTYKGEQYEGFLQSENIDEALNYFKSWYGEDSLEWIRQFKFETNDNLELWATVDMAIRDLKQEGKIINLETVKQVIKENKEWKDKLKRPAFSDKKIESAIGKVAILYT